jgi:phenylacetate-CoA ligase
MSGQNYFEAVDIRRMMAEYPLGDAFVETFSRMSRDELRALQDKRFKKIVARAWQIPFYQRLWSARGIEAGDIRGLDDITKLPAFSKTELMKSIEDYPPFGDFHGLDSFAPGQRPPVVFHTTSGTTGTPQNLFFGPWARELQNLFMARAYHVMGLRDDDVVHSVYGHGMINGGHYIREAFVHFSKALFLSAGTGNETRSAAQVDLMRRFGVSVIVGFADYIKKLAQVAEDEGLKIGGDIRIRMIISHLGREPREAVGGPWQADHTYDWYGVGDTGLIAFEGPDLDGMYVMEDGHYLEIVDPETGAPVADGSEGNMVVSVLFKDDIYPIIRFDTKDVSAYALGQSSLGLNLRRLTGFLGRSDNMVKLRGINLYPIAIGALAIEHPAALGEYICRATRDASGREEMTVVVEVDDPANAAVHEELAVMLNRKLGIAIDVELVARGETAPFTEIDRRQKAIRLIDERSD